MVILFTLLFLASLVFFIIGLINPRKSLFWAKKKSRGLSSLIYGIATFVFLVLIGGALSNFQPPPATVVAEAKTALPVISATITPGTAVSTPISMMPTPALSSAPSVPTAVSSAPSLSAEPSPSIQTTPSPSTITLSSVTPTSTASAQAATATKTPSVEITFTPEPTTAATPKATQSAIANPIQSSQIKLISITSSVNPGQTASIAIQGTPNTQYSITVTYKSGPSTVAGLDSKTSDSSGKVGWSWKVGTRTTSGSWPVDINGGGQTFTAQITVQ